MQKRQIGHQLTSGLLFYRFSHFTSISGFMRYLGSSRQTNELESTSTYLQQTGGRQMSAQFESKAK
jgi:hypothetical protein